MTTNLQQQEFIEEASLLIPLMGRGGLWDGIKELEINEWRSNFQDLRGEYFALKILLKSLYYTEKDIIQLLDYGLNEKIFAKEIREEVIRNRSLILMPSVTIADIKLKQDKTIYVPLSASRQPHESGQEIIRHLTQNNSVRPEQCVFHWDLTPERLKNYERLVIVDDCIGSGQQFKDFWNDPELASIKQALTAQKIRCYYFVLIAYKPTIEELKNEISDIEFIVCEELTDEHRVFHEKSFYWESKEELEEAKAYFIALCGKYGLDMYGWKDLDFAVFIHRTVPDWSLPLFWKKVPNWKILLPRKNSSE